MMRHLSKDTWEAWVASTDGTWNTEGKAAVNDPKLKQFRDDPETFHASWKDRLEDAEWILERIDQGNEINLVYWLFGLPVGILCMDAGDPASIAYVVTHPATADAGATLIEAAVDAAGRDGRLRLVSLYLASTFYQRLGFAKDGIYYMLTPASPLWARLGNKWRLTQYNGTSYFNPSKPLPPLPLNKK